MLDTMILAEEKMNCQCRHEGTMMTLPEDGEIDEKQPRKGCGR